MGGQEQVGQRGGCGYPSWLRTRGPNPQKIMHTRKRHQDMFQDLNRKLQHAAEKEKEVPGIDSKVRRMGSVPATTGFCPLSTHPHSLDSLVGLSLCYLSLLRCANVQGRWVPSLALSGRFQTVLPHSTELFMGTAATAKDWGCGMMGGCSL